VPPNVPNVPSQGTPLGQRYLLHEAIGRGAMGSVYRATRRDTGEELAAKVLHPELADDRTIVARFVQEGAILTGIRDPHVVAVRDLVVDGETLAILSDLVEGTDLRRYLRAHGPLPAATAAGIAAQILRGLAAGHAEGVIHRDIKPENVLVDSPGSDASGSGPAPPLVRVTDFGVARLAGTAGLTRMTSLIGTPDYMAPEMAVPSPVTEKVDVLHLGGDTNWFVGQSYRSTFVSGALKNGWWAFTLSDKDSAGNSHWGWVPETYFKGGANNEPDAGLFVCGTHANSCSP